MISLIATRKWLKGLSNRNNICHSRVCCLKTLLRGRRGSTATPVLLVSTWSSLLSLLIVPRPSVKTLTSTQMENGSETKLLDCFSLSFTTSRTDKLLLTLFLHHLDCSHPTVIGLVRRVLDSLNIPIIWFLRGKIQHQLRNTHNFCMTEKQFMWPIPPEQNQKRISPPVVGMCIVTMS